MSVAQLNLYGKVDVHFINHKKYDKDENKDN